MSGLELEDGSKRRRAFAGQESPILPAAMTELVLGPRLAASRRRTGCGRAGSPAGS